MLPSLRNNINLHCNLASFFFFSPTQSHYSNPLYDNVHGATAAGLYDTITPGNPLAGIHDVSGARYVQESISVAEKEDTL